MSPPTSRQENSLPAEPGPPDHPNGFGATVPPDDPLVGGGANRLGRIPGHGAPVEGEQPDRCGNRMLRLEFSAVVGVPDVFEVIEHRIRRDDTEAL